MKKVFLLGIFIIIVIFMINSAEAAVCGGNTPCGCGDEINESYVMTNNTNCGELKIIADNIIVDCSGNSIVSNGTQIYGIGSNIFNPTTTMTNITIMNCNISYFDVGIFLVSSYNFFIKNNTITHNDYGVNNFGNGGNHRFFNNNFTHNEKGVTIANYNVGHVFWKNSFIENIDNFWPNSILISGTGQCHWNHTNIGNYWDDFVNNSGYPHVYNIPTGGVDYHPVFINNSPPTLFPIGNKTVDEGQQLDVQLNATDPENLTLIYSTDASLVLPSNFSFSPNTGLFSWTPGYDDSGEYFVTFSVSDGQHTVSERIKITVNDIRTANLIAPRKVKAGSTINFSLSDHANPGSYYFLLLSLSNSSAYVLPDNRSLGINMDSLTIQSIYQPLNIGLVNTPFFLTPAGNATVWWNIPNNYQRDEYEEIYAVFVTVDSSLSFPSFVRSISNVEKIVIVN